MAQQNTIFVRAPKLYLNQVFTVFSRATSIALPLEEGGLGGGEIVARRTYKQRNAKLSAFALYALTPLLTSPPLGARGVYSPNAVSSARHA
jgi:hypothetical protein